MQILELRIASLTVWSRMSYFQRFVSKLKSLIQMVLEQKRGLLLQGFQNYSYRGETGLSYGFLLMLKFLLYTLRMLKPVLSQLLSQNRTFLLLHDWMLNLFIDQYIQFPLSNTKTNKHTWLLENLSNKSTDFYTNNKSYYSIFSINQLSNQHKLNKFSRIYFYNSFFSKFRNMIYHKPHDKNSRKSVKKVQTQQLSQKKQEGRKFVAKPAPNMNRLPKIPVREKNAIGGDKNPKGVSQKVQQLQKLVEKIQNTRPNEELQEILLKQIKGIKSQLSEIKHQIGMKSSNSKHPQYHQEQQQQETHQPQQPQEQENIMNFKSDNLSIPLNNNNNNKIIQQQQQSESVGIQDRPKVVVPLSQTKKKKKVLIEIGKIQPYMKEFKLEGTQNKVPQPYYQGYHKKSSKPVIVKYCQQSKNMDFVTGMYERLWKNIVKAKSICINKIYDLNEPLAAYILVIEQNKCGLEGINMNPFKIAHEILKALQFFHDCGYLYRNIHPSHVMRTYEGNIVLIDLKNMKKFIDHKGKAIDLKANDETQELDEFVANSRIKGSLQGRKDDLQCLGYLTLFMLEGKLPWNAQNMVQVRSKLMLNQIFGKYPGLLKFMIEVHKLPTQDMPNYNILSQLLQP